MTSEPDFIEPNSDPFEIFGDWYGHAESSALEMPNAMTLATVDSEGRPNARVVLLKGWDVRGFQFYTNYQSPKGHELLNQRLAAAVFWWEPTHRQVRIRGQIQQLSPTESDEYFQTRDRRSQIGAWASNQSSVISGREDLDRAVVEVSQRFAGKPVTRPPHWGGFLLIPFEIEFWQERPHRLHDRMVFRREGDSWSQNRLSP